MATPEDLAKAREIATQAGIYCRYDCKRVVKTSGMDHIADCPLSSINLDAAIDAIAAAISEARTTPNPAAEVVEALEAIATEIDDNFAESEFGTVTYGKFIKGLRDTARAALAAQSARGSN